MATATALRGTSHSHSPATEDSWRSIARTVERAQRELTPATTTGRPDRAAGSRAVAHLTVGRFLLQRAADRRADGARTRIGQSWRRWVFGRSAYAKAFDESLAYARAAATGSTMPIWKPVLFQHTGRLPLLERFMSDRFPVPTNG